MPRVRRGLVSSLAFSGAHLDDDANQAAKPDADVARRDSAARILVVRAREDLVILRETLRSSARLQ